MQHHSTALLLTLLAVTTQLNGGDRGLDPIVDAALHRIEAGPDGIFRAGNPRQHLEASFHRDRTEFRHGQSGSFTVTLTGTPAAHRITAQGRRVDIDHGGSVTEWFINQPEGLEQGFTVARRQCPEGPLTLALEVGGDYTPALDRGSVVLRSAQGAKLTYGSLMSWDADGRRLPSHAEVHGRQIRLVVDDSNARYPVTVDPIFQEPAIIASDGVARDNFGFSVAISGNTAVVGAPFKNTKGQVIVFVRSNGAWVEQTRLNGEPDAVGLFGYSVAISGNILIVGQPVLNAGRGAAHVYIRNGSQWTLETTITPDATPGFGWSVAVDGETAVVGTPNSGNGKAFAFVHSNGDWVQQAVFTPPSFPNTTAVPNWYGISVSVSGDTAVIGAPNPSLGTIYGGVADVFVRIGNVWSRQKTLREPGFVNNTSAYFGFSVAVSGDTIIAGAPQTGPNSTGAAHVFIRTGADWTPQARLDAADRTPGIRYGSAVALSGDIALVGAPGTNIAAITDEYIPAASAPGATYFYTRNGTSWLETRLNLATPPALAAYGTSVALNGSQVLAGSPGVAGAIGEVESLRLENVSLISNPAGRTFTLSGAGCGTAGTFTTPYSGFWTSCTVQWPSSQTAGTDTRYTFLQWADANTDTTRTFQLTQSPTAPSTIFAAAFKTEYLLTTQTVPVSGGAVTGSGWYTANTIAAVAAIPNPGFVFTGFSGGLSGVLSPQTILMSGPKTVNGNFATTPPAIMSGIVSAKSGTSSNRVWNITLTNSGPGIAYNAQLYVLMFVQTFGTPCTALPVRISPPVLPASLGTLNPGASATLPVALDFSGCPTTARFTVSLGYMSNGGASGGLIQLANQFQ